MNAYLLFIVFSDNMVQIFVHCQENIYMYVILFIIIRVILLCFGFYVGSRSTCSCYLAVVYVL